jgi:chromosome segregation ATPase
MHIFETFVDLRQSRWRQNGDMSLWPSFTDIMTVILMIFMLTMIVVIIKNTDLARELSVSRSGEQTLASRLAETRADRDALKIAIADLEERLRAKEMEIILLGDEKKRVQSTLEAEQTQISALRADLARTEADADELKRRLAAAETQKELVAARLKEQMQALDAEKQRQAEDFSRRLEELLSRLAEKEAAMAALDAEKMDLELAMARERRDYLDLEDKYQRLIRPARSPVGKEVVTVQYARQDGEYRILLNDSQGAGFEPVSRQELNTRLGRLKERFKDKLYIKIVIPGQSGLSYNEAWNFTREVLSRYDYYYQGKEVAPAAPPD